MAVLPPVPEYRERYSVFEVTDHENKAENQDMPEWVNRYTDEGISGLENMPEYNGSYIFIGKQQGNNLDSLGLWANGFSIERDFSRLVSARIQARFIKSSTGNPAEEFGRYFENVIKNISDTIFTGAQQGGSFWMKKRIFGDDGLTPEGETYECLVLVSIKKDILERQINIILRTTRPEMPPTKEQASASSRLRINFFDGF
jgi:hypothetical protein